MSRTVLEKRPPKVAPLIASPKPSVPSRGVWCEYFLYLDDLRESGVTNMWGAGPYLQREFDLDENTARKVFLTWVDYFDREIDPMDRVETMLAKEAA